MFNAENLTVARKEQLSLSFIDIFGCKNKISASLGSKVEGKGLLESQADSLQKVVLWPPQGMPLCIFRSVCRSATTYVCYNQLIVLQLFENFEERRKVPPGSSEYYCISGSLMHFHQNTQLYADLIGFFKFIKRIKKTEPIWVSPMANKEEGKKKRKTWGRERIYNKKNVGGDIMQVAIKAGRKKLLGLLNEKRKLRW